MPSASAGAVASVIFATFFSATHIPTVAYGQQIKLSDGMAFYEAIRVDIESAFTKIESQIAPIGEPKPFSLLNVIVGNLKTFRQIEINHYNAQLVAYCEKLANRDARINLDVAQDRDSRVNGASVDQVNEKTVIQELRSFCIAPGNQGRQPKYWNISAKLEAQSKTLYDEFLRRRDKCATSTRCKDGVNGG